MFEKIRNLKNKKGFTLVELIVVLVILAILAALLVPALTGYIDRAKKQSIIAETRQVVMAAQTLASEKYGTQKVGGETITFGDDNATIKLSEVETLAEVKTGTIDTIICENGKIASVVYKNSGNTCTYTQADGQYKVS